MAPAGNSTADIPVTGCYSWAELAPDRAPVESWGHSMIYDPVRDRIVSFGGYIEGVTLSARVVALNLGGTPGWTDITPAGSGPIPRAESAAVYDSNRDRLVVIGGYGETGSLNDVWALDFATNSWSQLFPSGTPPAPRVSHSAIYDGTRDRIVVYGGYTDAVSSDVWALTLSGTPAWSSITPSGSAPPPRQGHAAIYDAPRDRMVIYGGYGTDVVGDVWTLSFADTPSWTQLTPSGTTPIARAFSGGIFDAPRNRLLVFGGQTSVTDTNELWSLTLTGSIKWTKLTPSGGPPPPLNSHATIYDPVRQRLVSFGGIGAAGDQVWSATLSTGPAWSEIVPVGQSPRQRDHAVMVHDAPRSRMILFGGVTPPAEPLNDVWEYSLGASPGWTKLTGAGPILGAASGVIDSSHTRLIVFGGNDGFHDQNSTWSLPLTGTPTWTKLNPSGTPPAPRHQASAIYDPGRSRMVVFGGVDSTGTPLADSWALSLSGGGSWTALSPTEDQGTPVSLDRAVAYDRPRDRMLLVTGYFNGTLPQTWQLSFSGPGSWTLVDPGVQIGGNGIAAVIDPVRNRLLMFDGSSSVFGMPLTGAAEWGVIGSPSDAEQHDAAAAIYDAGSDRVVFFGGKSNLTGQDINQLLSFSFPANIYSLNFGTSPLPGGSLNIDPYGTCYNSGASVALTATPAQGFHFTGWSGSSTGSNDPLMLTMDGDKSITAHFAQPPPSCDGWRRLLLQTGALPVLEGRISVLDTRRGRLLALGLPYPPDAFTFQLWQLPLGVDADWQPMPLAGSGPNPRFYTRAVYDSLSDRILIYGGLEFTGSDPSLVNQDDVWAITLAGTPSWSQVVPPGGTGPHFDASLILDPVRDRLILFGGNSSFPGSTTPTNDTWALSLTGSPAWSRIFPVHSTPPAPRIRHAAIYDPVLDAMIVYGGNGGVSALNDVWTLSLSDSGRWNRLATGGAGPVSGDAASAIYDPIRDRMIVYGGAVYFQSNYYTASDSVFVLSLKYPFEATWDRLAPDGTLPGMRFSQSAYFDAPRDRMVITDGSWSRQDSNGTPPVSNGPALDTYALSFADGYWLDVGANAKPLGTVSRSPATDCYAPGSIVSLTAVPASGVGFLHWSGDASGTDNPLSVSMDGHKTIVAVFRSLTAAPTASNPAVTELAAPAPNPSAWPLRIDFSIARSGPVRLSIFDVAGREVAVLASGAHAPGRYSAAWLGDGNRSSLRPGVYVVRLSTTDRTVSRRVAILR